MRNNLLLLTVLSSLLFVGCAQNKETLNQSSDKENVSVTKLNEVKDNSLIFKIEVLKEEKDANGNVKETNIASSKYEGKVNVRNLQPGMINKDNMKPSSFLYKEDKVVSYTISRMYDEKGQPDDMKSSVDTGLSLYVVEKTSSQDGSKSNFLVVNLDEVVDWRKEGFENLYGKKEYIEIPVTMNMQELVFMPITHFEMTRFFPTENGKIIVKISLNEKRKDK